DGDLDLVQRPEAGTQRGDDLAPIRSRELVPGLVKRAPRQPLTDVPRAIRIGACAKASSMWNGGLREQADHPCLVAERAKELPVAVTDDQFAAHPDAVHPARSRHEGAG